MAEFTYFLRLSNVLWFFKKCQGFHFLLLVQIYWKMGLLISYLPILFFWGLIYNTYMKENSHQWCEWIWYSVGRWWGKKLVDIWSEVAILQLIEIILLIFSWLCLPAEFDAIILFPTGNSFFGSMMRNVLIAYTEVSCVWLSGKRKLLGGVVTGRLHHLVPRLPAAQTHFLSLLSLPRWGLIPFLFQVVWELQFTTFHYPEHSPLMPKPRSSDAYKSLTSVFIKVFNLTFTVASWRKSWCQWWRT